MKNAAIQKIPVKPNIKEKDFKAKYPPNAGPIAQPKLSPILTMPYAFTLVFGAVFSAIHAFEAGRKNEAEQQARK